MSIYYDPENLKKETGEIVALLKHNGHFDTSDEIEGSLFRTFLDKLVACKNARVASFVQKADHELISKLAEYLPENKFNLPTKNMFTALYICGTSEDWALIVTEWENNFRNVVVQKFIAGGMQTEGLRLFLDAWGINAYYFGIWIEKGGEMFSDILKLAGNADSIERYDKLLETIGVIKDTSLFIVCHSQFIYTCSKAEYIRMGENNLVLQYRSMESIDKIRLILNMLNKLSLMELDKFGVMSQEAKRKAFDSRKDFIPILEKYGLVQKYRNWYNRNDVSRTIPDAERRDFWLKYVNNNEVDCSTSEICVIFFAELVAIEFGGAQKGPAYLLKRDYYESKISKRKKTSSSEGIKSFLFSEYNKNSGGIVARMLHSSPNCGWWQEFSYTLAVHNIKPVGNA